MLRACRRAPGLGKAGGFPSLRASWRRHRLDRRHLAEFVRLAGLGAEEGVPLLYPHVLGFPLLMVILTHRDFPIPIWGALQIRNHVLQHAPIPMDALLDLEARVAGQRILARGAEVDLQATVHSDGALLWESLTTFYYRGTRPGTDAPSPLARVPDVGDAVVARWRTPRRGGLRCGRLTGDYNGVHWSRWWARAFGFRRAFHHPQFLLGQCLARLSAPEAGEARRLDAWLRGPVYYGADVRLCATTRGEGAVFALSLEGEERPAILGRWRRVTRGSRLLDAEDAPVDDAAS